MRCKWCGGEIDDADMIPELVDAFGRRSHLECEIDSEIRFKRFVEFWLKYKTKSEISKQRNKEMLRDVELRISELRAMQRRRAKSKRD